MYRWSRTLKSRFFLKKKCACRFIFPPLLLWARNPNQQRAHVSIGHNQQPTNGDDVFRRKKKDTPMGILPVLQSQP